MTLKLKGRASQVELKFT